ncbi:MAG: hypothetical protein P4L99_00990 [Chthoniobacter sp.]|nr:hypothetical protein [Chthoniobacter sp.]
MAPVLGVHLAATWMLVGLIWTIQIVAYPQFLRVGEGEFTRYHFAHCWRIGLLIAPLLVVEALSAGWLLYEGHRERVLLISIGLILVNWLCTATIQAPLHVKLMRGFDAGTVRRLILSNWLRTVSWTARGVLIGYVVAG